LQRFAYRLEKAKPFTLKGAAMSHATMLEHVKAELDYVDAEALPSIREFIARFKRESNDFMKPVVGSAKSRAEEAAVSNQPLRFIGENLTPEEYEHLSPKERGMLQRRFQEKNHLWLQEKFSELEAAWLVVIDGNVFASGKSLKNKPRERQISRICRRTGKFPLIFVNEQFITIEESTSSWHKTKQPDDYYPTLPVILRSNSNAVQIVGDFDTGAFYTVADYDFLVAQNIIQPKSRDYYESRVHLNKTFDCIDRLVHIELPLDSGKPRTLVASIYCVPDWHSSPFVLINPNRIALIGRDILLELESKILLDFERPQTEILSSVATTQARTRKNGRKKRSLRVSRRRRK
jgi:hypothetical protein